MIIGLSKTVDWLVDRPLRIVLILLVATVINLLVRRAVSRFTTRLLTPESVDEHDRATLAQRGMAEIGRRSERAQQRVLTLGAVLRSLSTLSVYSMAALLVLGELDIDLGPLIAGAGIAGVAIGFGAQSLVRDFLAGVFIIVEDQYGVGDIVDLGEATGTVEKVSLRATTLRDLSGTVWVVPNGEIKRVGNLSQLFARSIIDFTVDLETDIDAASAIILDVANTLYEESRDDARIIAVPQVMGVESIGAEGITVRLSVTTEPSHQFAVGRLLRARIKSAFDAGGVSFATLRHDIRRVEG